MRSSIQQPSEANEKANRLRAGIFASGYTRPAYPPGPDPTNAFYEVDGLVLNGPGDLVTGVGLRQIITGGGTITSTGTGTTGTNPDALFNLQVNLFWPEIFAADPVVKYAGQWWPAMSISCATRNSVALDSGGESDISFTCDTYDPSSTTEIGAFTFFGVSVPVLCADLAPGETRTFSGSIDVTDEWA